MSKNNIQIITLLIFSLISFDSIASTIEEQVSAETQTVPNEIAGKITKVEGEVFYHRNASMRSKRIKGINKDIFSSDMLRTKKKSKAFLTLIDGSVLILDESSVIHFNGIKHITANKGVVLFDIKKQGQLKGLKIVTKTAVIGIKGTRFMINASDDSLKLYMKEGVVNVEALNEGKFAHHVKKELTYNDFMKQRLSNYSEYKKKQQEEFIEYVKSIDVHANKAISINGNKLEDIKIPQNVEEQFKLLDELVDK